MDASAAYDAFSQFYDSYTRGHSDDLPVYLDYSSPGDTICEVGCGSGRVLKALLDSGRSVTGIDVSGKMLELARSKLESYVSNGRLTLMRHDFSRSRLERKFDRVFITWYTFNYVEDGNAFLENLRSSLEGGSLVLLDLFYPLPLQHPKMNGSWIERKIPFEGEDVSLRDRRIYRNGTEKRTQVFHWQGEDITINTERRFWAKAELNALLKRHGFGSIMFCENYSGTFRALMLSRETNSSFMCMAEYKKKLLSFR